MSPRRPDDRDRQPPKSPPLGVPAQRWNEESTDLHNEPWLFRALRDIKEQVTGIGDRQTEQGEAIAEIRGQVNTLASFVPRPKSPTGGQAFRRQLTLKVVGAIGAIAAMSGALLHWWLG